MARAEGGLPSLTITITGLPTTGPGRWLAVGLAATAILGAGSYAWSRRRDDELPEDALADLREAREALLDEIVSLERAHKSGEVGPKSYERLRAALLDALARIVEKLEGAPRKETA